jgi:hypothetical protein
MKTKLRLARSGLFASCFLLWMGSAFGQSIEPLVLPLEYPDIGKIEAIGIENQGLKDDLNILDLNTVTLRQMGQLNQATILQFSGQTDPSMVLVNQDGNQNKTTLVQAGQRNATDISQVGDLNRFYGVHTGEDLVSSINQTGSENTIFQYLNGSNMDFQIIQNGTGHEVIQIENGNGKAYKVTQTGSDMKVTIIQDYVLRR